MHVFISLLGSADKMWLEFISRRSNFRVEGGISSGMEGVYSAYANFTPELI